MSVVRPLDIARPDWTLEAACRGLDPNIFYPERGASLEPAKKICASCPVRIECAQYAIDNGDKYGIWGGLSEKRRRRVRMSGERLAS